MSLIAGQSLSFFEILGSLGAGAMGEVYRAKDTRLEREAKSLASLTMDGSYGVRITGVPQ